MQKHRVFSRNAELRWNYDSNNNNTNINIVYGIYIFIVWFRVRENGQGEKHIILFKSLMMSSF